MQQRLNEFGDAIFDEHDEYGYLYFGRVSELGNAQIPARLIKLLSDSISVSDAEKFSCSKILTDASTALDAMLPHSVNASFACVISCVDTYRTTTSAFLTDVIVTLDATKRTIYSSLKENVYVFEQHFKKFGTNEFGSFFNITVDEFGNLYKNYVSSLGDRGFYTREPYVSIEVDRSLHEYVANNDSLVSAIHKEFDELINYTNELLNDISLSFSENSYIHDVLAKTIPMFLSETIAYLDTFTKSTSVVINEYTLFTERVTNVLSQRIGERLYVLEQYIKDSGFDEFGNFLNTTIDEFGYTFKNYISEVGSRGFFKRVPYVTFSIDKFNTDGSSIYDVLQKETLIEKEEGVSFVEMRESALEKNVDEALTHSDGLVNDVGVYLQDAQVCLDTLLESNLKINLYDYIISLERLLKLHGAILKTRAISGTKTVSTFVRTLTKNLNNIWRLR